MLLIFEVKIIKINGIIFIIILVINILISYSDTDV